VTGRVAGPSLAASYLSLLVLLPTAAVLSKAFTGGFSTLWANINQPETFAAIRLSIEVSAVVVVINAFAGTAVAWLLVRERFPLNRVIGALVDLPFALPTVIAGLTLITVYGPGGPIGLNIVYTRWLLVIALLFVTLPFAVRSVQPVLEALDVEAEEAASSLGASGFTTFRKVILPSLMPAILTGAGLGFARAIGEYGSVTLVSGNLPFKTEVATVRIFGLIESDNLPAAAATSLALFVVALIVLAAFALIRRRFIPPEGS
jgi:sulfate transport system permease protein